VGTVGPNTDTKTIVNNIMQRSTDDTRSFVMIMHHNRPRTAARSSMEVPSRSSNMIPRIRVRTIITGSSACIPCKGVLVISICVLKRDDDPTFKDEGDHLILCPLLRSMIFILHDRPCRHDLFIYPNDVIEYILKKAVERIPLICRPHAASCSHPRTSYG
jgi:hypothetical protein